MSDCKNFFFLFVKNVRKHSTFLCFSFYSWRRVYLKVLSSYTSIFSGLSTVINLLPNFGNTRRQEGKRRACIKSHFKSILDRRNWYWFVPEGLPSPQIHSPKRMKDVEDADYLRCLSQIFHVIRYNSVSRHHLFFTESANWVDLVSKSLCRSVCHAIL